MKLNYSEQDNFVFIDKPAGFSIHHLVEIYSKHLAQELSSADLIDIGNTGATILIKKRYAFPKKLHVKSKHLFVTDRISGEAEYARNGIHFVRVKRSAFFELWEARSHLHLVNEIPQAAAQIGLPILTFPHLCLHTLELEIPGTKTWTCPAPRFFERLAMLKDPQLSALVSAIDTRQRLFQFLRFPDQSLRLSHAENPDLRIDRFGRQLWIYWYKEKEPNSQDLARFEVLSSMLSSPFALRKMKNRGSDPNTNQIWEGTIAFPERWIANEGQLSFHLFKNRGLSPGLFLDQRKNRDWVLAHAKDKSALNLFAYSCGFSVAAAIGGAKEVCSVDVSQDFLNWGQENFQLNNLTPANYEFFKQDSILFLEACQKRQRKFDLIICDPPTFGRHKGGVFKLEKDWKILLQRLANCLNPNGIVIFSTNLENWTIQEWKAKITALNLFRTIQFLPGDWDFEGPEQEPLMKSFRLQ